MTNTEKFKEVLKGIADNIRTARGTTDKIAFGDLVEQSSGLEVPPEMYLLVDESGNEIVAALVDEEVTLTATANDVRKGTTVITEEGIITGEKEIPAYVTTQGWRVVTAGSDFMLAHTDYDYTKLQALFCVFNTNLDDSVATDKVVINDVVYNVSSTEVLSTVTKDHDIGRVLFGITNDSDSRYLIRYFMYKEVY